jgi:hypothetical protein
MHTKTTFYAALLLKLLKLYPYPCFDPRKIVSFFFFFFFFFAKSYSHFKHMILNILLVHGVNSV